MTLLADQNIGNFEPPTRSYSIGSASGNGLAATQNFELFISNAISVLTILGGLFFVFHFVLGALSWTTAGGEQGKVTKARDQMIQAVLGMVVIIISYGLIGIIGTILGFDFLHPGCQILKLVGQNPGQC